MIDQTEAPCAACVAERPSNATSVAVSKLKPIKDRPEHAANKASGLGQAIDLVGRETGAGAQSTKSLPQRAQDDQVGDREREQQQRRDARSDDAADAAQLLEAFPHNGDACGNPRDGQSHDNRMPERKVKAEGEWPAAFLAQLAGCRVDGGDMVGIDSVAQAKAIGDQRRSEQQRPFAEGPQCPHPGCNVRNSQEPVQPREWRALEVH